LQSTTLGAAIAIMGFVPKAVPVALVLLAGLTAAATLTSRIPLGPLRPRLHDTVLACGVTLVVYAMLSAAWAIEPITSIGSVGQVAVVLAAAAIVAFLLPRQLRAMSDVRRRRFLRALPLGALPAVAFVLFELVMDSPLTTAMLQRFPALAGEGFKDVVIGEKGGIVAVHAFHHNRSVAALVLVMPATALATFRWTPRRYSVHCAAAVALLAAAMAFLSEAETAKLAVTASAVAALAVAARPRLALAALALLVASGSVLAVPLARLPAKVIAETGAAVPPSLLERARIWSRTADEVLDAPVFGIGAQSTRFQPSGTMTIAGIAGERRELGWHAHNFILQAWLELGAVGAALMMLFALALLRALARLPPAARIAGAATFTAGLAIAVTGWGLWQSWLIAAIGLAAISVTLVAHLEARSTA
jgi:O-antigen ligase